MGITFAQPLWLLLLLLIPPMAIAGLMWFGGMSRARKWSAVITRAILLALIACMLAGASAVRTVDHMAVIAVVDVSGSIRRYAGITTDDGRVEPLDAVRNFLIAAVKDRGPDDLLGIVAFDGRAAAILAPTRVDALDRSLDVAMQEGTNIAEAIRLAAAMIPPDAAGRLLLFSDGNETAGNALAAASEVAGRLTRSPTSRGALPIDVVGLTYTVTNETMIEFLDLPPTAAAESVVPVRIGLYSTNGSIGSLRLLREGEPVPLGEGQSTTRRVALPPGRSVYTFSVKLDAGKLHRFEAIYEPDTADDESPTAIAYVGDQSLENNRAEAFTITPGRGSVLILDGVGDGVATAPGAILAETLRRADIDVTLAPADGLPGDMLQLQRYDLVILQNVPAEALDQRAQQTLVEFVSDLGGGLVMIGGPDSFGAGGWHGSTLEPILPVRLDLPEQLIVPEAAIVFVLDSSGSMNRSVMGSVRTQQEIANEAAALAVKSLDAKDLVGVIEFNSLHRTVVPLGPNTDPERTAARIRSIAPGGGTVIGPALRAAGDSLMQVDARVKHIILLSDGLAVDRDQLVEISRTIADEGIIISTISVGNDADDRTMRAMAAEGNGAFYQVISPNVLPRVFLRAVRVVRSPMIRQTPFDVVVLPTGSPLTTGLQQPPRLGGMVLTQPRPEPTITTAMIADSGEPILAHWNVGLGQVAAFTSDAHNWASRWLDWPGYAELWARIARVIARPATSRDIELRTTLTDGLLHVAVELFDAQGRPVDGATIPISIFSPTGDSSAAVLSQSAPGVYEWSGPAEQTGNYVVIARPSHARVAAAPVIGGVSVAAGAEYRALTSNITLLEDIASLTGGRRHVLDRPDLANLFDRTGIQPIQARTPIWRTLLAWAIFIMLLDVGTRRIAWDRYFGPGFGARARAATLGRAQQTAAATLERLRTTKTHPADAPSATTPLTQHDADALRASIEHERYAAMLEEIRRQARARGTPQPTDMPAPEAQQRTDSSDLFAAKRRAAERFRDSSDEKSQDT